MKIKLKFNNWIAKLLNVGATVWYPYILFSVDRATAEKYKIIEHEMIHVRQVRKLGWFKFYVSYIFIYFKNWFKYGNTGLAYRNHPYEMEAFENEHKIVLTPEEIEEIKS